ERRHDPPLGRAVLLHVPVPRAGDRPGARAGARARGAGPGRALAAGARRGSGGAGAHVRDRRSGASWDRATAGARARAPRARRVTPRGRVRRETLLAGGPLAALYLVLRQRTGSLDGPLHTLPSTHPTPPFASRPLLPPP